MKQFLVFVWYFIFLIYFFSISISRIQDICILFNALVLLIMLINTYMFQAGLMSYMINKFRAVWLLTIIYFALTLAIQIWLMVNKWLLVNPRAKSQSKWSYLEHLALTFSVSRKLKTYLTLLTRNARFKAKAFKWDFTRGLWTKSYQNDLDNFFI